MAVTIWHAHVASFAQAANVASSPFGIPCSFALHKLPLYCYRCSSHTAGLLLHHLPPVVNVKGHVLLACLLKGNGFVSLLLVLLLLRSAKGSVHS